jgi:hypothetical protein
MRLHSSSWEEIVKQIQPVPTADLERLALDNLRLQAGQLQLEPVEMWELVGGMTRRRCGDEQLSLMGSCINLCDFGLHRCGKCSNPAKQHALSIEISTLTWAVGAFLRIETSKHPE